MAGMKQIAVPADSNSAAAVQHLHEIQTGFAGRRRDVGCDIAPILQDLQVGGDEYTCGRKAGQQDAVTFLQQVDGWGSVVMTRKLCRKIPSGRSATQRWMRDGAGPPPEDLMLGIAGVEQILL